MEVLNKLELDVILNITTVLVCWSKNLSSLQNSNKNVQTLVLYFSVPFPKGISVRRD